MHGGDVIELDSEERGDQLQVELHDVRGMLAAGTIHISSVWEVWLCADTRTSQRNS